ncbi:hypothetical protein G7046_g7162 [Stylonectria norvegica]|nr:hypothetical protein G7046_g7162 [Stylonectria norvegica]
MSRPTSQFLLKMTKSSVCTTTADHLGLKLFASDFEVDVDGGTVSGMYSHVLNLDAAAAAACVGGVNCPTQPSTVRTVCLSRVDFLPARRVALTLDPRHGYETSDSVIPEGMDATARPHKEKPRRVASSGRIPLSVPSSRSPEDEAPRTHLTTSTDCSTAPGMVGSQFKPRITQTPNAADAARTELVVALPPR